MASTIQDIKKRSLVVAEEIENYIVTNKIKVGIDGKISDKTYLTLLDLFSDQEKFENGNSNGKSDNSLNEREIQINQKPVY